MKKHHLIVLLLSLSAAGCAGLTKQRDPITEAQAFCTRVYRLATTLDGEGFQARAAVAREKYPHFDAVVFNPDLSITYPMRDRITASDRGPEIAYYLGLHPEEARTITRLSPVAQTLAIERIEETINSVVTPLTPVKRSAPASDTFLRCVELTARQSVDARE
jgi:hypothetical protein